MTQDSPVSDEVPLEPASPGRMIAGHDGSACAQYALATALELADQLHTPVVIVRAWSIATAPRPPDWTFGYVPSVQELEQAVLDSLAADVRPLLERFPDVEISYQAAHGGPAKRLIEVSVSARMLVVGSRGLGALAEMMLGSVSDEVVRRARCPVLVTKEPQAD